MRTINGVLTLAAVLLSPNLGLACAEAQQATPAVEVTQLVDNAVQTRSEQVLGFTDIEHYVVWRGNPLHAVAEMTVRDTYTKGKGKTYTVLSESGSGTILRFGLEPLLDHETELNAPDKAAQSTFTSANYAMKLQDGNTTMNGHTCYAVRIQPRRKGKNMVEGTIWVDATDGALLKVEGVATKSPMPLAGPPHMMREYRDIDGYSMATHARAESKSFLFGRTVVTIDYKEYHLQVQPESVAAR